MGFGAGVSFARGGQMMRWQSLRSSGDARWLLSGCLKTFPKLGGCSKFLQRRSIYVFVQVTYCLRRPIRSWVVKRLYLFNKENPTLRFELVPHAVSYKKISMSDLLRHHPLEHQLAISIYLIVCHLELFRCFVRLLKAKYFPDVAQFR